METLVGPVAPDALRADLLSSAFLISVVSRFDSGVTEGHLHTLVYVGQKLKILPAQYAFKFQQLLPFCEDLDLKIAMLLWNNRFRIQDNRIRILRQAQDDLTSPVHPGVDKLTSLSYDSLKFLAAVLHLEQDLHQSRQEAMAAVMRLFPIREDQAQKLLQACGVDVVDAKG